MVRRDVYRAIADPTRRDIIGLIATRSMNLNAIADNFQTSRPAISQHIKVLVECGLVTVRKEGRERYCEATLAPLREVVDWLEQYRRLWSERYEALDTLLASMMAAEADTRPADGTTKTSRTTKKRRS